MVEIISKSNEFPGTQDDIDKLRCNGKRNSGKLMMLNAINLLDKEITHLFVNCNYCFTVHNLCF